jgi:fucose 4-O-acetylase-like acetyltransferase
MTSTRIQWTDYAKGLGIFLVVLGHTLRSLVNSSILNIPENNVIDRWIYAFHMPLFFLLSGLFIERSLSKPLKSFIIDKLKVIAYPYILWSVIQSMLMIIASEHTNKKMSWEELSRILYDPVMQFWFLYVLFIIVLGYAIARKLKISPEVFLLFCVVFYIMKFLPINLGWGVLDQACGYGIYLAIGAVIGSKVDLLKLRQISAGILLAIISAGFILLTIAVGLNINQTPFVSPVLAILGSVATIALAILMERFRLFSFVKKWGILSMAIYLVHTIASALIRTILLKLGISQPMIHLTIQTFVGIYLPMFLYMGSLKIGFRYMFRLP